MLYLVFIFQVAASSDEIKRNLTGVFHVLIEIPKQDMQQ